MDKANFMQTIDRLLLTIKPVVGKRHPAGRIFSADIRLKEIRRLIRISAAAGGTAPSVWVGKRGRLVFCTVGMCGPQNKTMDKATNRKHRYI